MLEAIIANYGKLFYIDLESREKDILTSKHGSSKNSRTLMLA